VKLWTNIADVDFMDHRASSLAAAAIICATDEIQDLAFTNLDTAVTWCSGLTQVSVRNCSLVYTNLKFSYEMCK
jgi:cyclin D1/2/4, plant